MTVRRRILILFAHPALEKSRVNRFLIEGVRQLEGVMFHDLYESYPDLCIDVRREQQLLVDHDLFIFHHPLFWYSTPAILKEWQDLVLEHGWAYGRTGTALRGKQMLNAITTGGREEAYAPDGYNRFTIRQLLAPIEQTFALCGVEYLPPFAVHGTHRITPERIAEHVRDYKRLVMALRDGLVDMSKARTLSRLNVRLDEIILAPKES